MGSQGDLQENGEEANAAAEKSWLWRDKDRPVVETSQQGRLGKASEEVQGSRTCHEPSVTAGDGLDLVTVGLVCQPKQQPETLKRKTNLFRKEQGTII